MFGINSRSEYKCSFVLRTSRCVRFMLLAMCISTFTGCDYFKTGAIDDEVLARVGDKVLLKSDIETILSEFSGMDDSVSMAKSFVNSWVRKQVLIVEADKYLKSMDIDFSQQLEDYKNSLIVYAYENDIANKELDTVVSDDEIISYYDLNKDKFTANETLFKGVYFKVSADSVRSISRRVAKMMGSGVSVDNTDLEMFCNNSSLDYVISTSKYIPMQTIVDKMPLYSLDVDKIYNKGNFSEFNDSNFTHYVYISEFIERGSVLPLELCKQSVKKIILRQRRFDFIEKLNKQLYDRAVDKGEIEVF